MLSTRRAARLPAMALVVLAAAGCNPGGAPDDGEADDPATGEAPSATVTIPPTRLTPFCQALIDLNERLETDPPDDVGEAILETYESIVDEVPDEISDDFAAVLADLRSDAPSPSDQTTTTAASDETPTSDPLADEGRSPGDTPSERVSAYVDFACRSVENNPGPPATQPLSEATTSEP